MLFHCVGFGLMRKHLHAEKVHLTQIVILGTLFASVAANSIDKYCDTHNFTRQDLANRGRHQGGKIGPDEPVITNNRRVAGMSIHVRGGMRVVRILPGHPTVSATTPP